jgi:hypothetical protein
MSVVLFETPARAGNKWRLEVCHYNGRRFANWRRWWRDKDGFWRPTRQGVTFPLERLSELRAAIEGFEATHRSSGPPDAS